jgi:hypothetical protein
VKQKKRPPRIIQISWGRMEVEGLGVGKDFKLYPGGGRAWDWAETGTRHSPGIRPADVEELVAHGATTVVLSLGMNKQLQVHPDTSQPRRPPHQAPPAALRQPGMSAPHAMLISRPRGRGPDQHNSAPIQKHPDTRRRRGSMNRPSQPAWTG